MSNTSAAKALKSGVWYTVSNFFVKGAGFLTTPIFTRIMTQEQIGDFSNLLSWISILAIVTTFELSSTIGVARYDFKDEMDDYMASNLLLGSTVTLVFYGLCLFFKDFALKLFSFSELDLHIAFAYLLTFPAIQMYQSKKQISYEYKASVLLSLVSTLGALFVSLLFIFCFTDRLLGRVVGHYGTMILINTAIYIYILTKAKRIRKRYWKYAIQIAVPMIVHMLAGNLLNTSDRIMIRSMCGSADAAMYTIAYSCGMVVQVLWQSMNSAWSPWCYEMLNKEEYLAIRNASKPYVLAFCFAAFCFLLVGPELLWLMGGSDYVAAVGVIPPVVCGYVFQFVYSLYVNVEFYYKKQKYVAFGTVVATVCNLVLNYLLIPVYGYVAAAYTTLIGYIVLFVIHFLFTCKMNKQHAFDTKFVFGIAAISLGCMALGIFLYSHLFLRYALVAVLFIAVVTAVIILRRELLDALKTKSLRGLKARILRRG